VQPSPHSPLGWQQGRPVPEPLPTQEHLWPNQGPTLLQEAQAVLDQLSTCFQLNPVGQRDPKHPPATSSLPGQQLQLKSLCLLGRAQPSFNRQAAGYLLTKLGGEGRNGQLVAVHRVMCWLWRGPPPAGHPLCVHLCGVPNCLNPLHLHWANPRLNAAMHQWHCDAGGHNRGLVYWRDVGGGLMQPQAPPAHITTSTPALA